MAKPDLILTFFGVFACGTALVAQSTPSISTRPKPKPALVRPPQLRTDVKLVQIPVIVTDLRDHPLVDLPRGAFRIFEDDTEQSIATFSMTDAPISATLVFDSSRSMKNRIVDAHAAVDQFLTGSITGDEFSLVRFSDKAELLSAFTEDWRDISRRLSFVVPRGWTALYDAVCLATYQQRKARNQRKVIVVFSDGADNNSRYSESDLIRMLREADIQVYAVSMFERPRALARIAEETGGRAIWVKRLEELPSAVEILNRLIRNVYVIGYSPRATPNDGKYRRIRIEVQPPAGVDRVHATWRRGYIAPGD